MIDRSTGGCGHQTYRCTEGQGGKEPAESPAAATVQTGKKAVLRRRVKVSTPGTVTML